MGSNITDYAIRLFCSSADIAPSTANTAANDKNLSKCMWTAADMKQI